MKCLIDVQLPASLCHWLERRSVEAVPAVAVGLLNASDDAIHVWAATNGAVILTKDEDFVGLASAEAPVVWLRCGNASNDKLRGWLDARWDLIVAALTAGEILVEVR